MKRLINLLLLFLLGFTSVKAQMKEPYIHYSFDNTLIDSMLTGIDMSAQGGATFDASIKAVGSHSGQVQGSDDYFITEAMDLGSTYAVSLWLRSDGTISDQRIFMCTDNTSDYFYLQGTGTNVISVRVTGSGSAGNSSLSVTTWTHFVFGFDKATGKCRIWKNGARDQTDSTLLVTDWDTNDEIRMGVDYYGGSDWDGNIDEVRFYKFMPSEAQVDSLYDLSYVGEECPAFVGGTIGSNQSIEYGDDVAAFTSSVAASGGTGTITYQWRYSTTSSDPEAGSWTNISSSNTATYNYGVLYETTYFVRYASAATCGSGYSNVLTITVSGAPTTLSPEFRLRFENNGADASGNFFDYEFINDDSAFSSTYTVESTYSLAGQDNGSIWRSQGNYTFADRQFSIAMNFRIYSLYGGYRCLFSNKEGDGDLGIDIQVDETNMRLYGRTRSASSNDFYTANGVISYNTWYYAVFVFRNGSVTIFLDDVKLTLADSVIGTDWKLEDTISVGGYTTNDPQSRELFNGYMDNVQFYTYELSEVQADSLYDYRTSPTFQLGGLGGGGGPGLEYDPPQYRPHRHAGASYVEKIPSKKAGVVKYFLKGPRTGPVIEEPEEFFAYDDTYVLSCTQKFAIPENVDNGDDVGQWRRTYSWGGGGAISYSLVSTHNGAFAINSSTGAITIADASEIDGKIVQQDTLINLLVRTYDNTVGSEIDTAKIWVKENSYCVFLDYSQSTNGTGTRASPERDVHEITLTPGYGYFFRRGTTILNESVITFSSHVASATHPTVVGAYDDGLRPTFSNTTTVYVSQLFYLGTYIDYDPFYDAEASHSCRYVYWYDQIWSGYYGAVVRSFIPSCYLGFYNISMNDCERAGYHSAFVYNDMSMVDSAAVRPIEFINFVAEGIADVAGYVTNMEPSYMKLGAGPVYMSNCYFGLLGTVNNHAHGIRLTNGKGGYVKHCYFFLTDQPEHTTNSAAIQNRQDNILFLDNRIYGYQGILCTQATNTDYYSTTDSVTIRNCRIDADYRAVNFIKDPLFHSFDKILIEGNLFYAGSGIYLSKSEGVDILRNQIQGQDVAGSVGIWSSSTETCNHLNIQYNKIYRFNDAEIQVGLGSNMTIYNNTVDGGISFAGATSPTVHNNLYRTITTPSTYNLDIDEINTEAYFRDYDGDDFRLTQNATRAVNEGTDVSLQHDIRGIAIQGGTPDIGCYEYYADLDYVEDAYTYNGKIYVDPLLGSDGNTGYASIAPIQSFDALEDLLYLLGPGDTVYFADYSIYGTLDLADLVGSSSEPIVFTTYTVYGMGNAKLKGLTSASSGWTSIGSNLWTHSFTGLPTRDNTIYSGVISMTSHMNGMYINGLYYRVSRYPAEGTYLSFESGTRSTPINLVDGTLSGTFANDYWNGGTIVCESPEWVNTKLRVLDYTGANGNFYCDERNEEELMDALGTGTMRDTKYFIQNHRYAANLAGEWYQDYSAGLVGVYWPSNMNANSTYVPLVDNVITVNNCDYIKFEDLDFYGSNEVQLLVETSDYVTVQDCKFFYSPFAGVFSHHSRITIDGSEFWNPGDNGVFSLYDYNFTCTENEIHSAGIYGSLGGDRRGVHLSGIRSLDAYGDVTVERNEIDSSGYCAILVNCSYPSPYDQSGIDISIKNNYVTEGMTLLHDGAAIYCSGYGDQGSPTKIVRENIINGITGNTIYNQINRVNNVFGIYHDSYSHYWLVDSNYIHNVSNSIFCQSALGGNGNFVYRRNVLSNIQENDAGYDYGFHYAGSGGNIDTTRFVRNKIIALCSYPLGTSCDWVNPMYINSTSYSEYSNVIDSNSYFNPFTESDYSWGLLNRTTWVKSSVSVETMRAATSWEDNSTHDVTWQFDDVSGIDEDEFTWLFVNFSSTSHTFALGSNHFYDLDHNDVTGNYAVPAYSAKILFYQSGNYTGTTIYKP